MAECAEARAVHARKQRRSEANRLSGYDIMIAETELMVTVVAEGLNEPGLGGSLLLLIVLTLFSCKLGTSWQPRRWAFACSSRLGPPAYLSSGMAPCITSAPANRRYVKLAGWNPARMPRRLQQQAGGSACSLLPAVHELVLAALISSAWASPLASLTAGRTRGSRGCCAPPAERPFRPGDRIVAIDGRRVDMEQLLAQVRASANRRLVITGAQRPNI